MLCFCGQRPGDLLALGREHGAGVLLTCEGGAAAAAAARALGVDLRSVEDRTHIRSAWTNQDLDRVADLVAEAAGPCDVLSYAPSRAIAAAVSRTSTGSRYRSSDLRLRAWLDRKDEVRALCRRHGIPTPPTRTLAAGEALQSWEGGPVVAQAATGSAGRETWRVDSPAALRDLRTTVAADAVLILSPLLDGPALNFHVLVDGPAVTVSAPSVQLVGTPGLSDRPFAYCGGDFAASADVDAPQRSAAAEMARQVALLAGRRGWRGLLGVDVLVSASHGPVVLEVNPRLQASSWLLAEAEAAAGAVPLGALHRDLLLERPAEAPGARPATLAGAFLVFHATGPVRSVPLAAGVHQVHDDGLAWVRDGVGLIGCQDEEVVVEGVPSHDVEAIAPGAALARVATWRGVVRPDGQLTPWGARLVTAFRRSCERSAPADRPADRT